MPTRYDASPGQYSIDILVHLGAGHCSELEGYLALKPQKILLVEADPLLAAGLKKRTSQFPLVQVECVAVAGQMGPVTYHRYNLPDAGSLHPASGLFQLFPGLRIAGQIQMEAVIPDVLLRPVKLANYQNNQLIIELPGEELSVLKSLHQADLLGLFSRIQIYCGNQPLYEGSEPAARILEWLQESGFDLSAEDNGKDPDRPCWTLDRNMQRLQNEELLKQIEELRTSVEALNRERADYAKIADERQLQLMQANIAREEEAALVDELKDRIDDLSSRLEQKTRLADERQQLIDKISAGNLKQIEELSESLKYQQSRLDQMEQGLGKKIDLGLDNSIKQLESFIGIQTYLTRGQLIPAMHGWSVSPDLALYLINLIEQNDYDLILEFGSGTTTVLMAKAVLKQIHTQAIHRLQLEEHTGKDASRIPNREELENLIQMVPAIFDHAASSSGGMLPRIVSFEHHRQFFEENLARVRQAGVSEIVELVHAPLRDYVTWESEHFLYYACEEKFASLAAELNGGRSSILMLVDGPPATTGKHARYPALPIALQYLSDHKLDILLDDYHRQDEREIVERWAKILNDRSFIYESKMLPMEKNSYLISIK